MIGMTEKIPKTESHPQRVTSPNNPSWRQRHLSSWRIRTFFGELGRGILWILAGLAVITAIQFTLYPLVALPFFNLIHINLEVQPSDWNTVRAIWFAEVPLAYILRYLFGEYRRTQIDLDQNWKDDFMNFLQMNKVEEPFDWLKGYWYSPPKVEGGSNVGVFLNKTTHRIFKLHQRQWQVFVTWIQSERIAPSKDQNPYDFLVEQVKKEDPRATYGGSWGNFWDMTEGHRGKIENATHEKPSPDS